MGHKYRHPATAAVWQRFYDGICDIDAECLATGGLSVAFATRQVLVVGTGLPVHRRADARLALMSAIDCIAITLVTGGGVRIYNDPDAPPLQPGDLHLVDMRAPRDWRAIGGEALDEISLYVPRQRFAHSTADGGIGIRSLAGASPIGAMVGATLRTLGEQKDGLDAAGFDAAATAIVGLAIAGLRTQAASKSATAGRSVTTFDNLRRFVDVHLMSDALTPDLIAGQFGMSRAVLYRMFEPVGGVATYIRRQRMARAVHEIGSVGMSGRSIGVLARRFGYISAAAFTRAFRETYGVTPSDLTSRVPVRPGGDRLIDLLAPMCGRSVPTA